MRFLFLIYFAIPSCLFGQTIAAAKEATAFIYLKDSLGNLIPNGTCFIIGKWFKQDSVSGSIPFFVTAKHVISNGDGTLLKEFYIRMNTKDSNSRFVYFKIDTTKNGRNIFFNKDKSVDIAVLTLGMQKDDYKYKFISEGMIPSRTAFKSLNIEEGTEAFLNGLFVNYAGEHKIYPIFRFGNISLITDEKISWVNNVRTDMILVEISSFGGNSGSPVFFKLPEGIGGYKLILGGILSGTYRDMAEVSIISTKSTSVAAYNNGVSGVTPAYLLEEIFHNEEFLAQERLYGVKFY